MMQKRLILIGLFGVSTAILLLRMHGGRIPLNRASSTGPRHLTELSRSPVVPPPRTSDRAVSKGSGPGNQTYGKPALPSELHKRAWDPSFFSTLTRVNPGEPIQFELMEGRSATGEIRQSRTENNQLVFVSGILTQPASGRFFFHQQSRPGVAGAVVGAIEFPTLAKAYRIEPTGPASAPELVERTLQDVLCAELPRRPSKKREPSTKSRRLKLGNFTDLPIAPYQQGIAAMESLHGARAVVYLDFAGGYTPSWNGITYARPDISNDEIRDVWQRVAEDFLPFNINVTTDLGIYQNTAQGQRQRVIITPTDAAAPEAGGAAYIGSFNWTGEEPCWVFMISGKDCAEACSHEIGHALNLNHYGRLIAGVNYAYFAGQGSGQTGWAPIMGLGYDENVSQWCIGEYFAANNHDDQLGVITTWNNGVTYRSDDTGDTLATSRYLEINTDFTARAEGIIERTGDTDAFQFSTAGGLVSLRADPASAGPNLAIKATLCDGNDTVLVESSPQDALWAAVTTNLPGGTYSFRVSGAGRNDPLTNGFSNYASLGYYSITGFVAQPRVPDRFQVQEHAVPGTLVGTVTPIAGQADPRNYAIVAGNSGGTFSINARGDLTVADNQMLDYFSLAAATQLAVQFELFVNITDIANDSLSETNRRVVVAVLPMPPALSEQPQDVIAAAGKTISLYVAIEGSVTPQVQWFFNGSPLPGAVGLSLTLTNVQAANSGEYFATLTNWFSAVTSRVATVTVTPSMPHLVRQPQPQGTFPGYDLTLSSLAVGSEPLVYQWQQNGTNIPGANQAQLTLSGISRDQAGSYRVVVHNSIGQTQSDDALIAMVPVAAWGQGFSTQSPLPLELTNTVEVAAGGMFDLALKRDGTILVWGTTNPPVIQAGQMGVVSIAAGFNHAIALGSNGTVRCWGDNSYGQLQLPAGLSSVVAVAAGANHNLALKSTGQVAAWGAATFKQATLPIGLTNVVAIAAGSNHSLALRADGAVIAWGDNSFGQTNVPTNLTAVIAIAAGQFNSFALKSDGTLVGWGAGVVGGPAGFPNFGQSTPPASATNVSQISCGALHTVAVIADGAPFITISPVGRFTGAGLPVVFRVVASGAGPLGYQWQFMGTNIDGATNQLLVLGPVEAFNAGLYTVSVSNPFGVAISQPVSLTVTETPFVIQQPQDQNTWVGGSAQLQIIAGGLPPLSYQWWFAGAPLSGATNSTLTLDDITFSQQGQYSVIVSNKQAVISSQKATLRVSQVAAWGIGSGSQDIFNNYGQIAVPGGLTGVVQVAAGGYHSLALKGDGTVVAWGAGIGINQQGEPAIYGQCLVPAGLDHVVAIAAGRYHSLALTDQGRVIAWGAGTTNLNRVPHFGQSQVPTGLSGVIAIAAGDYHSVALKQDGRVVVWGGGFTQVTNMPLSAINIVSIASRGNNIMALTASGTIVEWGNLITISPSRAATAIAAGDYFSVVLNGDGTVSGWGNTAPPPGLTNLVQISAGDNHVLGVKASGTIITWGQTNLYGLGAIPRGISNVIDVAGGLYHSLAALGNRSILIKSQPTDREGFAGSQTAFTVSAAGAQPIRYQWRFNHQSLAGATNSWLRLNSLLQSQAGLYDVVVTNLFGAATSRVASLKVLLPIGPALGSGNLAWTSTGDVQWFGQTNISHDGFQAAQSGQIGDSRQSSLRLNVIGPGVLSYWWKVSSEQWFDYLNLYLDKVKIDGISGGVDWEPQSLSIPPGPHTVAWNYEKDASGSVGLDSGWVDEVVYVPSPPVITTQPLDQTVMAGQPISLSVSATDSGNLTYRWFKDGEPLPGFMAPGLFIGTATRQNSGQYQVQIANAATSIMSSSAVVRVLSPQRLIAQIWMSDGTFRIVSTDGQGIAISLGELSGFQAQVSSNLIDWIPLSGQLWFDSGNPIVVDHDATNYQQRFYRMVEHTP